MSFLQRLLKTFQSTSSELNDEPDRMVQNHARPLVREIQRLARREGMQPDEMTVEILQAGIADRQAYHHSVRLWRTLTRREKEVAALVCLNLSNDEIAEELSITRGTVRTHVRHILHKFRVENRSEIREMLRWWEFSLQ